MCQFLKNSVLKLFDRTVYTEILWQEQNETHKTSS